MSEPKSNGELFSGAEQIRKTRESLSYDWNSGEIRMPKEVVEKKFEQVKQAKEDLAAIYDLLVLFDGIKLNK